MKKIILAALLLKGCIAFGQFHVRVIPNPDNEGQVCDKWVNNYVVQYTTDKWLHGFIISNQQTWADALDGTDPTSFYQNVVFKTNIAAIAFAKHFRTAQMVGYYESQEYSKHLILTKKFNINKKSVAKKLPCEHKGEAISVY